MKLPTTATALALVLGLGAAVSLTHSASAASHEAESQGKAMEQGQGQAQEAQEKAMEQGQDQAQDAMQQGQGQTGAQAGAGQGEGQYTVDELRRNQDEWMGRDVVNQNGEEVGELTGIVLSEPDRKPHAVVEIGGILGLGAKEVAFPFRDLEMGDQNITLMSQKSEEELETMQEYDETQYMRIEDERIEGTTVIDAQ